VQRGAPRARPHGPQQETIMADQQRALSRGTEPAAAQSIPPRVDIFEDDTGLTLLADLPGVPKERLGLKVEGDTLTIEGDINADLPDGLQPWHAEIQVPRYRRAFTLSRELDAARIEAEYRNGVLQLRIPKAEHAQPRKIAVQVH